MLSRLKTWRIDVKQFFQSGQQEWQPGWQIESLEVYNSACSRSINISGGGVPSLAIILTALQCSCYLKLVIGVLDRILDKFALFFFHTV